MNLQSFVELLQTSKLAGQVLLGTTAIVSSFLTETLTNNSDGGDERAAPNTFFSALKLIITCLMMFMLLLAIVLVLIKFVFHIVPQEENLWILLKRVAEFYGWSIVIPFAASMIAGIALREVKRGHLKGLFCLFLALAVVLNGLLFFQEAFRVVQRPTLPLPVEAVSFIVNSRLRSYPFILSGDGLQAVGDGSELLAEETGGSAPALGSGEDLAEMIYEEPNSLSGYIWAIFDRTYAPGMGKEDYLRKAYEYYRAGRYTNNDLFYIGVMWDWMYDSFYIFSDMNLTPQECLDKAIEAYQKEVLLFGESAAVYNNLAVVYSKQGERDGVRRCVLRALEISPSESNALSNYKDWIYDWVDDELRERLMGDAKLVLDYEKNLSMYLLYGACAVAENIDIPQAYELLCTADDYYKGRSAMVKIFRCICADLMGQDESWLLSEVYTLEQEGGLTYAEELYLVRYLFATNRYEEMWGYIAQSEIGLSSSLKLDAELAAMKASWYFKNQSSSYFVQEDVEQLLSWVETSLSELPGESEERETLMLSRTLLQSCLGLTEDAELEMDMPEGPSDLEWALMAVRSFNAGKYPEALQACERFFQMDTEEAAPSEPGTISLRQLEPQEQVSLRYYVQLVSAYSNFEYAKTFPTNSESWTAYMETAERECEAFRQSSKSLFYIGEQFKMLQISIEEAQGKIPEELET